jgi:hypothetical protein
MMVRDFDEKFKDPPTEYCTMQIIHCFEGFGNSSEQIEDNLRKLSRQII